jgi:molecular chaperone DnaK
LREFGDKVPAETKSEVEAKVAEVKKAAEGEDVPAIKSATEALSEAVQKIGAAVYEQPNAAQGEAGSNPEPDASPDPDVVEGEVKE